MAASTIAISFDSSDESVGSPPSRVILFGDIPTVIPFTSVVAPETSTIAPVISPAASVVETTLVASPAGLCGLIPYSDFDSNSPDEMSSPEHISPLPAISPFLCTDSSKAPDSSDGPPSQDPYVMTVAHWRSKVASRPSSSSEFPFAFVTAPPGIPRRSAILIRPGEAIPCGRPYRTHLNGPRKLLTARKRVGPLPARRLVWRRASPRSSDHRPSSSSSSSDSSPVHSSGLDALDQAHSGSSTRDVSPRLESSSRDSSERPLHSSSHSAGPSRKRCRSPVDSVPSSTPVMGSLAPTHADLLPPRKRFRDSYSSEASIEEDTEIDSIETEVDMELGIGDGDDVRDHVENYTKGLEERLVEPSFGRILLISSGTRDALLEIINQRVDAALEARRVNRDLELGNGNDNGGDGNGNGTGNGNNGGDNGDSNENRNVNGRGDRPVARECTYQDFMKCQPLSFKGTKGVVGLIRWSEKMETVFHISNCPERYQVKYATCTLLDSALTWWTSHKRTIRTDAAYSLSWKELLKLMTEVYNPRNEIQKMETEL
ncbi:hypothetical protein Tco_0024457 [Tanacetum coccineum]